MIRCEKCGHKLRDTQQVCDICNTPVKQQEEDFVLEEELAKSIASIVESETSDAKVYLKQIQGTLDRERQYAERTADRRVSAENKDVLGVSQRSTPIRNDGQRTEAARTTASRNNPARTDGQKSNTTRTATQRTNSTAGSSGSKKISDTASRSDYNRNASQAYKKSSSTSTKSKKSKKKSNKAGKITIIVLTVILTVVLLVGLAFFTINYIFKQAQDNYTYYNNTGIEYVQNGQYAEAIPYLQKALTYDEAKGKVNVRFTLYDCYAATGDVEKAISMLYNILAIDPYNLEAIVNLETYYENAGAVDALKDLYNTYKDTEAAAAVSKYFVETPAISVAGGKYTTDMDVKISSAYDFDIYYTLDGSEPTISSTRYTGAISVADGTTILKCITVNDYGIISDVVSEEYDITYEAPKKPTISPASGTYDTDQMIVIGNIPAGGKAYYTLDNTTPSDQSIEYDGIPFEMPEGNNVLSVIVYDKNGLASDVVKRNYVLNVVEKISKEDAEYFIWDTMKYKNMIGDDHKSLNGEPVTLELDGKKSIDDITLWVYKIFVYTEIGNEEANYKMGVDVDTSFVYIIHENNGQYTLEQVAY